MTFYVPLLILAQGNIWMNTAQSSKMLLEETVMLENKIPHIQSFRTLFSLAMQQTDVGIDKNG